MAAGDVGPRHSCSVATCCLRIVGRWLSLEMPMENSLVNWRNADLEYRAKAQDRIVRHAEYGAWGSVALDHCEVNR